MRGHEPGVLVSVLTLLQSVLDYLGPGNVVLGIVGLVAAPLVDRLFVRRKRLTYRLHYNSRLGVGPEPLHDPDEPDEAAAQGLAHVARLLDRMSVVIIRIRNTGSYDIQPEDFAEDLTFSFPGRAVWNARISEAREGIRERLKNGLEFFGPRVRPGNLAAVRRRLRQLFWSADEAAGRQADQIWDSDQVWDGVKLRALPLPRGQKFKLVVILREPADGASAVHHEVDVTGRLRDNGLIKDEKGQRWWLTLPAITGGLALALTVVLLLSLVFAPARPTSAQERWCASGRLDLVGSSVFMPTMTATARDYEKLCPEARLTTTAMGSLEGARALQNDDGGNVVALSDGRQAGSMHGEKLAVVVYHVVVNRSVGLRTITTAQLRAIYAGRYTNWSQLGGPSLPIRIVGRGQESGTRVLFERNVLGPEMTEGELSSNGCQAKDRNAAAPTIRCERDSNAEVVQQISRLAGAIGYADAPAVTTARKDNRLLALVLDGRVFDISAGVTNGYPFWTVEYYYTKSVPEAGTLTARVLDYLRTNDSAQLHLKDAGFLPCAAGDGSLISLCDQR